MLYNRLTILLMQKLKVLTYLMKYQKIPAKLK